MNGALIFSMLPCRTYVFASLGALFRNISILLILLALSLIAVPAICSTVTSGITPNVLIISSYHHGHTWSEDELHGLLSALREVYPTIEPSIEHMDAKRHVSEIHALRFKEMLQGKYGDRHADIVVVLDNPALDLVLNHRNELFDKTPVVFGGINNFTPDLIENHQNITGVAESIDVRRTLETALTLHQQTRSVLVVHDYSKSGLAMRREVELLLPLFIDRVDIHFTEPLSFDEAVNKMRSLPPDSIGLILSFMTDRLDRSLTQQESARMLTSVTTQPVYAMHETCLGHGIVGGMIISGTEHGNRIADIVLRVLKGESADTIPVDMSGQSREIFDFNQLNRFGLQLTDLPDSGVVINKPLSFYERYRSLTLGAITVALILLIAILVLSLAILKLKRSHAEISRTKDSLGRSLKELEIRNRLKTILLKFRDEEMFEEVLKFLLEVMNCRFGIFGYFDDDGSFVAPALTRQIFWEQCNIPEKAVIFEVGMLTGIWAQSIREKRTLIKNQGDFSVPPGHIPIENTIVTPIILKDLVVSSILLSNKPGGFNSYDAQTLELIASQIAPILYAKLEGDRQVSEQNKTEALLRESEERFRLAMEAADEGLWDWNALSGYVYFSPGWSRILGYSSGELAPSYKSWESRIHPDEVTSTLNVLRDHIEGRAALFQAEHRLMTKDGHFKWVLGKGRVVEWDEKGAVKRMIGTITDIEYRKAAEKALAESENRFKLIFDNHHAIMLLIDPSSGRILDANRSAQRFYGYELSKLLSKEIYEINMLPPKDIYDYLQNALSCKNNYFIFPHRLANGELRTVEVHSSPIEVQGDRLLFSIIHDISERKEAEDQLEKSERFLDQIIENIPDMIFVKDAENLRFVRFNKSGEELLGYSREELLGKNDYDFFPSDQADFFTAKDRDVIAGKELTEIPNEEIETKYKGKRILRTKKIPIMDTSGTPQFLLGISTDITDQKNAEDALRSAYTRLSQIFECITGLILVIDSNSHEIIYANKFSEDLYGKKLEGGICYEKLNNLGMPCEHCSMSRVIKLHGQPYQAEYYNQVLNKHLLVTERIIKWPDGRDVKFHFAMDVSDIKQAEREKEMLQSQLLQAQKMEAVGTLAGGIAHDFNNLLQVVLGYSEVILDRKKEGEADYRDVQKIYGAGKRGADLVKNLLTFSRKVEAKYVPIDINEHIESMRNLLSRTIPKNITIDLQLSTNLESILADSSLIDQVLMNLAVNARDAMPNGGIFTIQTANVALDEDYCNKNLDAQPGKHVMITFGDTGHGMNEEVLEHIFEPFFTTKEVGKGTGLGLASVYGIVKQLRGHITCHSEPGHGTTFKIYLPSISAQQTTETGSVGADLSGGGQTILLVDDEDEIRNLGKSMLKRSGYNVVTASNGREALDIYVEQQDKISLIILDLIMPVMDGIRCLRELLIVNPEVRVIIASGFGIDSDEKNALEKAAKGFVEKPFNLRQLLDSVRNALDQENQSI